MFSFLSIKQKNMLVSVNLFFSEEPAENEKYLKTIWGRFAAARFFLQGQNDSHGIQKKNNDGDDKDDDVDDDDDDDDHNTYRYAHTHTYK